MVFRAWNSSIVSWKLCQWVYRVWSKTFDIDHEQVSDDGTQYRYTFTLDHAFTVDGGYQELTVGQTMEFEASQFLLDVPEGKCQLLWNHFSL